MAELFRRLLGRDSRPSSKPPEPLSIERIDAGYRMYWLTMAAGWDAARRQQIAARVAAVIAAPGFEANALERRFRVEGLDDQAHSGASLLALDAVLRALDNFEPGGDN